VKAKSNVDVNALSRKNVSTYAVSVGGGFVGVAGSVSVWTVGPQATKTYHDGAAGPDRGAWSSATASKTTLDTDGVTVIPDVAVRYHKGNADAAASGEDDSSSGAPGFKKVLNGSTAGATPAWVTGTSYKMGQRVTVGGHEFQAKQDVVDTAASPDVNTTEWANNDKQA